MAGRPKLDLNPAGIALAINRVEKSENPPKTHQELWERVIETPWLKELGVSVATIKSRVQEFNIKVTTPKGKKGGDGTFGGKRGGITTVVDGVVVAKPRKHRMSDENRAAFIKLVPKRVLDNPAMMAQINKWLNRAQKGSLRAAVNLDILEKSNFQKKEIKKDPNIASALYGFRPYQ